MKTAFIFFLLFLLVQAFYSEELAMEGQPQPMINASTPLTNRNQTAPPSSENSDMNNFSGFQTGQSEKKLVISGKMTAGYEVLSVNRNSPLYPIMFYNSINSGGYLTSFYGNLVLALDFVYEKIEFHYKAETEYVYNDKINFRILEGVNRINFSINTMLEAGIIRFKWGKGYAWNPVGFINPYKNLEDMTREYAGKPALHFQFQKSLSGNLLKSFALNIVILPEIEGYADRYGKLSKTNYAAKLYFLLFNMDIDLIVFSGPDTPAHTGADISFNIVDAVEFHSEFAYIIQSNFKYFNELGVLQNTKKDTWSVLAGFTIKITGDTTINLEYMYNSSGLNGYQYGLFLDYAKSAYTEYLSSGSINQIDNVKSYYAENYKSGYTGRHYLYFKIQEKDLFGITYLNPYIYLIINLVDKSLVISPVISYSPFQNMEINGFFVYMAGKDRTEFGANYTRWKTGANIKIFF